MSINGKEYSLNFNIPLTERKFSDILIWNKIKGEAYDGQAY